MQTVSFLNFQGHMVVCAIIMFRMLRDSGDSSDGEVVMHSGDGDSSDGDCSDGDCRANSW